MEYRTKSGRVLTDADIEALADEAELGYDINKLVALSRWSLTYMARPWTLNQERGRGGKAVQKGSGHWSSHSGERAQWRRDFKILAKQAKIPPCEWISVTVRQICRTNVMPDTGNIFPAIKAAIDGLVDARVISKDTREYVHFIGFAAPVLGAADAVVLDIKGKPVA